MRIGLLFLLAGCPTDEVEFPGDDTGDTGAPDDTDTDTPDDTDDTDDTGPVSIDDADLVLAGAYTNGYSGSSISAAGDLDGDGLPDLIVGAYNESAGAEHSGAAYLVTAADLAAADPTVEHRLPDIGRQLVGNGSFSGAGINVAGGEDVDGDGLADVIVAAFHNPYDAGFNGVHIFSSPATGAGSSGSMDDAEASFACANSRHSGSAAFGGDSDADGREDVLIGCPGDGDGGVVYVMDASTFGLQGPADATSSFDYGVAGYYAGTTVTTVGDVDGDGLEDLGVGGFDLNAETTHGYSWVIVDHDAGAHAMADQAHTLVSETAGDWGGFQLMGAGDADGDGRDDVIVTVMASDFGAETGGAILLLSGLTWAGGATTSLPDGVTLMMYGTEADGYAGLAVAPAGDVATASRTCSSGAGTGGCTTDRSGRARSPSRGWRTPSRGCRRTVREGSPVSGTSTRTASTTSPLPTWAWTRT